MTSQEQPAVLSATTVIGDKVVNPQGENLGKIEEVMLDVNDDRIAYAVLSFGGFLGMGEKYHPLPWKALTYDPSMGGYVVDLDKRQLENAPTYERSEAPDWGDPSYGRQIDDFYGPFPGL